LSLSPLRSTINDAFQRDPVEAHITREMIRGRVGMEVEMDREGSQKEEEGEGHPGARSRLLYPYQDGPRDEEDEEYENKSSKGERKVKMA